MTRVRFAPAPTGFLHIGGARTFLFHRLYARHWGGQIVPRIDETGVERSTAESLRSTLDGLAWTGRPWDDKRRQSGRRAHSRFSWYSKNNASSNACGVSEC